MNVFIIILLNGLIYGKVYGNNVEDAWEEPNIWRSHLSPDSDSSVCSACDIAENSATFCYQKLVSNLFHKDSLKKNEYTGDLEKTILFTVTEAQLSIIQKSTDIRDIDAAVTEILKAAKVVANSRCTKEIENTSFIDYLQGFEPLWSDSELRFICFIFGVMMLMWFIHKRYNKNLIAVVAVVFFLFGYIFTYLECNRKLNADELVEYVEQTEGPSSGWFDNLRNSIFKSSKKDEKVAEIRAKSKLRLPFCRPDTVLLMYANEMFLNQLELIINKCMEMTRTFKSSLPFPYNIVAMISMPFLFFYITKLIFKYLLSPSAWLHIFKDTHATKVNQASLQQPPSDSNTDRITGSNVQLLLQALAKHNSQKKPLPSGVEEVLECLENGSADCKPDELQNEDDNENCINLDKVNEEKLKES